MEINWGKMGSFLVVNILWFLVRKNEIARWYEDTFKIWQFEIIILSLKASENLRIDIKKNSFNLSSLRLQFHKKSK